MVLTSGTFFFWYDSSNNVMAIERPKIYYESIVAQVWSIICLTFPSVDSILIPYTTQFYPNHNLGTVRNTDKGGEETTTWQTQ